VCQKGPSAGSSTHTGVVTIGELATAALQLGRPHRRTILGIAGPPGVGKTTLVQRLLTEIGRSLGQDAVAHVPMDGFHLADAQLRRLGLADRKGAPETFDPAGYTWLLRRIRGEMDQPIYVPGFDRELEQPVAAAMVVPPTARLVITEGNYLLLDRPAWREVRAELDQVWFLLDEQDRREQWLIDRHVRFGKDPVAADAWVRHNDRPNAELVTASMSAADRLVGYQQDFSFR